MNWKTNSMHWILPGPTDPVNSDLRENSSALVTASALKDPDEYDDEYTMNIDKIESEPMAVGIKNVIIDKGYALHWSDDDKFTESYKDDLITAVTNIKNSTLNLLGIDNR